MQKSTRQSVNYLLIFLVILIAGDRLIAYGIKSLISYSDDRFVRMYNGNNKGDIVILGNSRGDRHFTTSLVKLMTGQSSVNLALGGTSMVLSEILLRDYLDIYKPPKLVIIEATNLNVVPNELGDMRIFSIYSPRISKLSKHLDPRFYYKSKLTHLFIFNTDMFIRILYGMFKEESDRLFRTSITEKQIKEWNSKNGIELVSYKENEAALVRIIELCDLNNIKARIIISPYLDDYRPKLNNLVHWKNNLNSLVNPDNLWDYSSAVNIQSYFRDRVHLNKDGATFLINKLIKDGFFDGLNEKREHEVK